MFEKSGWSVFQDLAGSLTWGPIPIDSWLAFAGNEEFVLAAYNEALVNARLLMIESGRIVREFRHDPTHPEETIDRGRAGFETNDPVRDWTDVASFVDGDDLLFEDSGLLWAKEPG